MKNILSVRGGEIKRSPKTSVENRISSTEELVAEIRGRIGKNPVSIEEANKVLVRMDFDDVERQIFGVRDLSVIPTDIVARGDVVPSGYPFMERVRSLFSHRVQKKGIFSLR